MQPRNQELKLLLSLGLDYIRWTQLTPMLMAWAFALLALALLVFVNFQQQAFSAMEYLMQWLMQLPLVGAYFAGLFSAEDARVKIGTDDLKSYALWGWSGSISPAARISTVRGQAGCSTFRCDRCSYF